jgi:hypothetical protein
MPKAVRYDEFGGIDVLQVEEVARPVPGDGAHVDPLAQVREAYTELERRHTHAKIILRP